jgi:hypothetical protein
MWDILSNFQYNLPLITGLQMRSVSNQTISILTNKEILAINQDDQYGAGITPFRWGVNVCSPWFCDAD